MFTLFDRIFIFVKEIIINQIGSKSIFSKNFLLTSTVPMVNVTWVNIMNILYSGLIISGGSLSSQSVEVYIPSTGQHCELPDMPDGRHYHSMEGMEVCGGDDTDTQTSCLSLTDEGTWERTTTLLERR